MQKFLIYALIYTKQGNRFLNMMNEKMAEKYENTECIHVNYVLELAINYENTCTKGCY